jgi:chromosome segregation ATPase
MAITRCILRMGLIGGLALGAATLLWPQTTMSVFNKARTNAQAMLDQCSDNPEALRRELTRLAEVYPERIADVRGEIAEVEHQLNELDRDVEVASRVVAMTTDDLEELRTLVARAEQRSESTARPVAIRFESVRFSINEAYSEARRINQVRQQYKDRLAYDQQQRQFLGEQRDRLSEILVKLEDEFNTYQAQLWQLDRQIDAVQRNERLIELTKEQQATLETFDRMGKVQNLKQLEAKLAELRTVQEAQLQALAKSDLRFDYEDMARSQIEGRDVLEFNDDPFSDLYEEIESDDNAPAEVEEISNSSNSVAWAN